MKKEDLTDTKNEHPEYDESEINHHDFDGIKELNNPSPYWIIFLFIFSIGFSLFYAIKYFGYPGNNKDQVSEYKQQLALNEKNKELRNKESGATGIEIDDKQAIAMGEKLFAEKGCIACHGTKGEGNAIGPNLTDQYWINGCKKEDVVRIITNGKPDKGMTPFNTVMTDQQIKSVSTFILTSLAGSNPANAKAPQGVECK